MCWAGTEFSTIDLGDKRLSKRAKKLLKDLGDKPSASIPAACGSWGEIKAAYRFFDHQKVTAETILSPHISATMERMKNYDTVLLIQDTTQLNFSGQKQKKDIGPLNRDNHRGILLHPTIAVTPDRICLGVLDGYHWHRTGLHHKSRKEKNRNNLKTPITQKESFRWVSGYRIANDVAQQLPKQQIISISDREGDIYDVYHEAERHSKACKADWLIRAVKNRPLLDGNGKRESKNLWDAVRAEPVISTIEFELPARKNKPARQVKQVIRVKKVKLHPPTGRRGKLRCESVEVNALAATEIDPPKGEKPIEWLFITSLSIGESDNVHDILCYYLCRWQIEIFFKIIKSGCQVEKLQLTNSKRLSPCLALYLIVAWRILYLTCLNRIYPNANCELIFDKFEWQTLYMILEKKKPPHKPPSLNDVTKMLGKLGGFVNRKNDGNPGPTVIWMGLQRLKDFVLAGHIFFNIRPEFIYG